MIEEQTAEEGQATSDTLLDAAAPQLGEGEYFLTEGVKGSGDLPEWYKADKYKSVADQAKAYTDLEKKFGGFTGAPEEGYQAPEGIEADDETFKVLSEFASESNMNQDTFNKAWELLTASETASEEINQADQIARLGDNAAERIKTVETFMKNKLDPETYEEVRFLVKDADSIQLVEAMIKATAPEKLPIDGGESPTGIEWADIEREMYRKDDNGNLMRTTNRAHEQKIQRMMKEFGGDRPHVKTVG